MSFFKNAEEEECSQSWALIPGIITYPSWLQTMLYTVILIYLFLGIAIVSDIFMNSVEAITSHETTIAIKNSSSSSSEQDEKRDSKIYNTNGYTMTNEDDHVPDNGDNYITVKVWNPTVANLTLLALGSSAPEILLAIYETITTLGDTPGELGPSTIVGSASFNLFVISAICILTIPSDSIKKISKFGVFVLTSIVSVAVYVWMLIVLDVSTPGVVTITEAVITVLGFPALVAAAYLQDIGTFDRVFRKYFLSSADDDSAQATDASETKDNDIILIESNKDVEKKKISTVDEFHDSDNDAPRVAPLKPQFSRKIDDDEFNTLAGKLLPSDDERQEMEGIREMLSILKNSKILDKNGKLSNITNQIITKVTDTKKGINFHRRNAKRAVLGKGSLIKDDRQHQEQLDMIAAESAHGNSSVILNVRDVKRANEHENKTKDSTCHVSFTSAMYNVYESSDSVLVVVTRKGMADRRIAVDYSTSTSDDKSIGSAQVDTNYKCATGTLIFEPAITHISIPITICNTHMSDSRLSSVQNTLTFQILLQHPRELPRSSSGHSITPTTTNNNNDSNGKNNSTHMNNHNNNSSKSEQDDVAPHLSKSPVSALSDPPQVHSDRVILGVHRICSVTIISDDWKTHPGILDFDSRTITINESRGCVEITVLRSMGARGEISVDYHTTDGSAVDGIDYHSSKGTLTFLDGEKEKSFFVHIVDDTIPELDVEFYVHLSNARGGAAIGTKNVSIVKIIDDDTIDRLRDEIKRQLETRLDFIELGTQSWKKQFFDAMQMPVNINEADGSEEPPTVYDAIIHFMTFNWKVLFAIVPPTSIGYGLPAFFVSLLLIGLLTALVGEFAELFGCSIGMKAPITAISFVALGTSLPDTFASYIAARDGDDADAAIGNIMGSNSVNVFLGLGIPWIIGSVYYYVNDKDTNGKYCVPTSSLVYSVMIFSVFAFSAFILLLYRRRTLGGELGGEKYFKIASFTFLMTLWITYLVLSALKTEGHISFGEEKVYDKFGCAID